MSFAVPSAALAVRMPLRSGLIADRQYTPSSTVASGKNFTTASAAARGGPGVTIGLLLNLCVAIKDPMRTPMMIFRTVTEFSIFDFIAEVRWKSEEARRKKQ
jgi:hypothetical protein